MIQEGKGKLFDDFLAKTNIDYEDYFSQKPGSGSTVRSYFSIKHIRNNTPYYRLGYDNAAKLREDIKERVIEKYKEIFGADAIFVNIP